MKYKILAWPKNKNVSANPYQYLLYSELDNVNDIDVFEFSFRSLFTGDKPNIIHIHWPDAFLASSKGGMFWVKLLLLRALLSYAKYRKIAIIWTAHNLMRPGQRNGDRMSKYFWPWFLNTIDYVIYMTGHSRLTSEKTFKALASKSNSIIPHGHYIPIVEKYFYPIPSLLSDLDQILFFGSISNYKGASKLLSAFMDLPTGTAELSIRGKMSKVDPDYELLTLLNRMPRAIKSYVNYDDKFLEDAELVRHIQNSDIVVFPYDLVMNSGAAIFALSVGRPILASDIPVFRELQAQVGSDWIYLFEGELDGDTLLQALNKAKELSRKSDKPDLNRLSWDSIARETADVYKVVVNDIRGGSL